MLIAILGSDERENEISRSDVIMLVSYKAKDNKVIIVSIPRDSKVSVPGRGMSKINSAYAFGSAKLQVKVLEDLFKVSNTRYIHLNFKGFAKIIDTLGGIRINAKKDFKWPWGKNETYAIKGENILKGDALLKYVRFRHDAEGDFGRIERQQEVLSALAGSILTPNKIVKLPEIALIIAKNSDSDMNIFYIMKQVAMLKNLGTVKFEFYTLETYSEKSHGIWYEIIDEENLKLLSGLLNN
jgi:LCP family protein required for cell wall assembly